MNTRSLFRILPLAALVLCPALHAAAAPTLKALIVTGQNNHNWPVSAPILKTILEDTGLFTVETATSPAQGGDMSGFAPVFAGNDVVVLDYNGDRWPEAVNRAFLDYVSGGGGVVVFHAANNAFPDWPEYNEIIGLGGWGNRDEKSGPYLRWRDGGVVRVEEPGPGGGHGKAHEFALDHRAPEHPILKGLPARWMHATDELYHLLRGPGKNLEVLATAYDDPATNGRGHDEPILFTIAYGKGRVFQTALGHPGPTPEETPSMQCAGFITTLQRGAEWAATGAVTQPVPGDFPTTDAVSLRPDFRRASVDTIPALLPQIQGYKFGDSLEPLVAFENICRAVTRAGGPVAPLEDALLAVIESGASADAKRWACKVLSLHASEKSVPAMVKLLGDPASADAARLVLQRMPGGAADQALLDALKTAQGVTAAGIAQTLGARKTQGAEGALGALLKNTDPVVAAAAAGALGNLGGETSFTLLTTACSASNGPLRDQITDAVLRCLETLPEPQRKTLGMECYTMMDSPEVGPAARGAALRGRILCANPDDAARLVVEAMRGDDAFRRNAAVAAVRCHPEPSVFLRLTPQLAELPAPSHALLLAALAERDVAEFTPAFLAAAESEDPVLRGAGLAALGRAGRPQTAEPLLALVLRLEGAEKDAAMDALGRIPGAGNRAQEAVEKACKEEDIPRLIKLTEVAAALGAAGGVMTSVEAAAVRHPEARDAAIALLATASTPLSLTHFLFHVEELSPAQQEALMDALVSVAGRLEPGRDRTEPIMGVADKLDSGAATEFCLRLLGRIGDDHALQYLKGACEQPGSMAAVEALANWPTAAPLETLRELAKTAQGGMATQALKGYVRLLGMASERSKPETVALYTEALNLAKTPEDRAAVVEGLGATGDAAALPLLYDALADSRQVVAEAAAGALGGWPDAAPLEKLAAPARDKNSPLQTTALRGYVRLLGLDQGRPAEETAALYREALGLAPNTDEQKRIMSAVAASENAGGMMLAAEYLEDPALREEAAVAVVRIAKDVAATNPAGVKNILESVLAKSGNEYVKSQTPKILDRLERFDNYLTAWQISGPHMETGKKGAELFDIQFAPEKEGAAAEWQPVPMGSKQAMPYVVEIEKILPHGNDRAAYLRTFVHVDAAVEALLEVGSDDGARVWVNGKEVIAVNMVRPVKPASDTVKVSLNAGWNSILMKITQVAGQWGACARLRTANGGGPLPGVILSGTPRQ